MRNAVYVPLHIPYIAIAYNLQSSLEFLSNGIFQTSNNYYEALNHSRLRRSLSLCLGPTSENLKTTNLKDLERRQGVGSGGATAGSISPPLACPCRRDYASFGWPAALVMVNLLLRFHIGIKTVYRISPIPLPWPMVTSIVVNVIKGRSDVMMVYGSVSRV